MTASGDKRDCPLCGAAAARARRAGYGSHEWPLVQCEACDLVFMERLPPQREFEDERAWEVSSVSHAEQRKQAYPILVALDRMTRFRMQLIKREPKRILARLARPGPVVDVGCGAG